MISNYLTLSVHRNYIDIASKLFRSISWFMCSTCRDFDRSHLVAPSSQQQFDTKSSCITNYRVTRRQIPSLLLSQSDLSLKSEESKELLVLKVLTF